MKSTKPVKDLSQILKPFTFIPPVNIEGGVNGKNYFFPKGQEATLTQGEFEGLLTSDYGKYLD